MIRKILGFLPVGMALFMLFLGGADFDSPDTAWSFSNIPPNAWVWFVLSVASAVLLCFDGTVPLGLITGIIPYAYMTIVLLTGGTPVFEVLSSAGIFLLFYLVYAVCYYTYHHETDKP